MNTAPDIQQSTAEERVAYVREQWQCLNHCPSCGKCYILKGRDVVDLYADYIEGRRSYRDVTLDIRR